MFEDETARVHVPSVNKGGYRDACLALDPGDRVIVISRSRQTNRASLLPTTWVVQRFVPDPSSNAIGWLDLRCGGEPLPPG